MRITNSSSLIVSFDTSAALNFMVYLQNALLPVSQGRPKFPRLKPIGLLDEKFKQLTYAWEETLSFLQIKEMDTFPYGYEKFYREFFDSEEALKECFLTFYSWWESGGGCYLVSSVGNKSVIYDYAVGQSGEADTKLQVQIVYDEVLSTCSVVRQGFMVLSIPELETLHHTGEITDEIKGKIRKALS
ncbi:hypothetical protein [Tumebacillus flagellatus]|uniref:Uncharacterized protein n=1 Tax=Tumebacillus flagellatus TaxID=1157490 RepID=A0A074LK89_9BACL|nr:hypothetical protein [Tumebacillus flagellatus]KEO81514.1 hypothetical protein EL26_20145 [Tumebacillus flagellatus]